MSFYEVEKIVGKKKLPSGKVVYQVKWKGYASAQNTWESISNLENVRYMVEDYEKKLQNGQNNKKKGYIEEDVPKCIIGSQILDGKLYMMVRWKKRESCVIPDNSLVLYSKLKNEYPNVLLDYYENNLLINNKETNFVKDKGEFEIEDNKEK